MARIRTIKPEFFRHESLYEAERETGLPLRLAFAGLWTAADREGRFAWRPRALKLDVLPYDDVDFSRVLDALATRGFIVRYASGTEIYGAIPSWRRHQVINNRESASAIPEPTDIQLLADACPTRDARDTDLHVHAQGEGKGREGERKGREEEGKGKGTSPPATRAPRVRDASRVTKSGPVFDAYALSYASRYGVTPTRNAKVNGQLSQLVDRLGADEAPQVAAWYLSHNAALYVRSKHCTDLLLRDAEGLRTEWATGRQVTHGDARLTDSTQTVANTWAPLLEEAREADRLRALEASNGH